MIETLARIANAALSIAERLEWLPPLLVRLFVGYFFFETGWGKIHHLDAFAERFAGWGIPFPRFNAALSAYTELVGGALTAIGLATRAVSIPMMINMAVAIATVKLRSVSGLDDFVELDEPLYLLSFFWLMISGPGSASLDQLLGRALGVPSWASNHAPRASPARPGVVGRRSRPRMSNSGPVDRPPGGERRTTAMQYALLFYNPSASEIPAPEREARIAAVLADMRLWREELERAGVFRTSLRLAGVETATSLRGQGGAVLVSDGPFAETKEILGGLVVIDCADLDDAMAWARRCPIVRIGTVEVRPEWGATR